MRGSKYFNSDRAELDDVWRELHARDAVHFSRTQALCAKWQGGNDEMLEFANATADGASPGEPLGAILVAAHLEVLLENERDPFGHFATPSIRDKIARLAGDHDRARRHVAEVSATTVPNRLPWGYLEGTARSCGIAPCARASASRERRSVTAG